MEGEAEAAAEAGEEGGGVLEEAELAVVLGALGGVFVDLVGVVADDLAEFDAAEEVLVGLGNLAEHGIGPHVLDVGFDEWSALLNGFDDVLFADDGLVDKSVLARREFARRHAVIDLLLLAEQGDTGRDGGQGREGDGCQHQTGDDVVFGRS